MKVLLSVYACEPEVGSEPGAGWEWARAAAMEHEVWLLTRENNGPAIEAALAREPALRMHPVYVDLPATMRWWKRGRFGLHLYYFLWQWLAWRVGSTLHAREGFDVAHHLTFAVDWMPAGVGWVPGVPFVWGPVGGTTSDLPFALWRKIGWRGLLAEAARGAVTRPSRMLFGDRTARRSSLVLAQNEDVAKRFSRAAPVAVEPNVALHLLESSVSAAQPSALGRPAVFVGRLLPFKGLRLAVAALARPEGQGWSLDVFGEGPDEKFAHVLARRLGVHDRVRFLGQRPRSEVLRAFCDADALLFPSLHEGAGWAVGEAVALGCPVVCLDCGGGRLVASAGGASAAVPADANAVENLAAALGSCESRGVPSDRWNRTRLPALIASVYGGVAQQVDSARTVGAAEPHLHAVGNAPEVRRADQ